MKAFTWLLIAVVGLGVSACFDGGSGHRSGATAGGGDSGKPVMAAPGALAWFTDTPNPDVPVNHVWSLGFDGSDIDLGIRTAADADGDVYLIGHLAGSLDLGGGALTSNGSLDVFVTKRDGATGAHLWSRQFGGGGFDSARGVALDSNGDVIVVGGFYGSVDFGGGALASVGNNDIYVLKLSGADGSFLWARRFGAAGADEPFDVAVDASEDLAITGRQYGTVDFGGGAQGTAIGYQVFVLRLSGADGSHSWSRTYGGTNPSDEGRGVEIGPSGEVIVAGTAGAGIDFGGGALPNAGGADMFVAALNGETGAHLWSRAFGSAGADEGRDITLDSDGDVYLAGMPYGPVDFGGGAPPVPGPVDISIIKLSGLNGDHVWSRTFGTVTSDYVYRIAYDGDGSIAIAGNATMPIDLGGGLLPDGFGSVAIVAGYSTAAGDHLWSRSFGSEASAVSYGLSFDAGRNVLLTGTFFTIIDLGGGPHAANDNGNHAFLAKLDPDIPVPNDPPLANAGLDQSVHPPELVTLDGTGSTDPDGDYPLTYAWTLVSAPAGSAAALEDAATAAPSFTVDVEGEYVVQLVVTDSRGLSSAGDTVTISTFNSAPVADAGPDQSVTGTGALVALDGTGSFDDDGDELTYAWQITTKPAGSAAELDDPASPTPTFTADAYGDYVVFLQVGDPFGLTGSDFLVVSSENLPPVADAGVDQSVETSDIVTLDGGGSSDPNGDALTYAWSLVSSPAGSAAALDDPAAVQPAFVADLTGTYVFALVVSDGLLDSPADTVTVEAVDSPDDATALIAEAIETIGGLPKHAFKHKKLKKALIHKLRAVLNAIEHGKEGKAYWLLETSVLPRLDGCAERGRPDWKDWIRTCEAQDAVYPLLLDALAALDPEGDACWDRGGWRGWGWGWAHGWLAGRGHGCDWDGGRGGWDGDDRHDRERDGHRGHGRG